jgi:hypothetical protein
MLVRIYPVKVQGVTSLRHGLTWPRSAKLTGADACVVIAVSTLLNVQA